jgi:probable rRNA maturation factor
MSKIRGLNLPLLRRIAQRLASELFPNRSLEIAVYYVESNEMAAMNEKFLSHAGPTDVITFDYSNDEIVHGEIIICPEEALKQAREFGSTPQMELVRYLVHGLLHLRGYDDRQAAKRLKMKRAEDKWVRWVAGQFPCDKVWSKKPRA